MSLFPVVGQAIFIPISLRIICRISIWVIGIDVGIHLPGSSRNVDFPTQKVIVFFFMSVSVDIVVNSVHREITLKLDTPP